MKKCKLLAALGLGASLYFAPAPAAAAEISLSPAYGQLVADSASMTGVKNGNVTYYFDLDSLALGLDVKGTASFSNNGAAGTVIHTNYNVNGTLLTSNMFNTAGEAYLDDNSEHSISYYQNDKGKWEKKTTLKTDTSATSSSAMAAVNQLQNVAKYQALIKDLKIIQDDERQRGYGMNIDGKLLGSILNDSIKSSVNAQNVLATNANADPQDAKDMQKFLAVLEDICQNIPDSSIALYYSKKDGYMSTAQINLTPVVRQVGMMLVNRTDNTMDAKDKEKIRTMLNYTTLTLEATLADVNSIAPVTIPDKIAKSAKEAKENK